MPPRLHRSGWKSNCSVLSLLNGTQERKIGAFEESHGGTLFIDEVCDMPIETQSKILRVVVDEIGVRVYAPDTV